MTIYSIDVLLFLYTHTHIYIHTHICIYIYTYMHMYITFCLLICWWAYMLFALWLLWIIFLEHCVPIFESLLWVILDKYLKAELPEHIVILYLTFWETVKLFSSWLLHYFTFPPVMHESSNFLTSLSTLGIFFLKKL